MCEFEFEFDFDFGVCDSFEHFIESLFVSNILLDMVWILSLIKLTYRFYEVLYEYFSVFSVCFL